MPSREYSTTHIDVDLPHHKQHHHKEFVFERPHHSHHQKEFVFERPHQSHHDKHHHLNSTIDIAERGYRARFQPSYREEVHIETTVDPPREIVNDKMGYYDEDGKFAFCFVWQPLADQKQATITLSDMAFTVRPRRFGILSVIVRLTLKSQVHESQLATALSPLNQFVPQILSRFQRTIFASVIS